MCTNKWQWNQLIFNISKSKPLPVTTTQQILLLDIFQFVVEDIIVHILFFIFLLQVGHKKNQILHTSMTLSIPKIWSFWNYNLYFLWKWLLFGYSVMMGRNHMWSFQSGHFFSFVIYLEWNVLSRTCKIFAERYTDKNNYRKFWFR